MLFNADKCRVMHVGYNNNKKHANNDVNELECVSEEKDLGVIISEDLKWQNNVVRTM